MAKEIVFIEEAYSDIYDIGEYYLGISDLLNKVWASLIQYYRTNSCIANILSYLQENLSQYSLVCISI